MKLFFFASFYSFWSHSTNITSLALRADDPLGLGKSEGSLWGGLTAFWTKDYNRFSGASSGPFRRPAGLATVSCNDWMDFHVGSEHIQYLSSFMCNIDCTVPTYHNHCGWTPFCFMYDPKCSTTFPWCTIDAPAAFAWCTINVPAAFAWCTNHFVHKLEFSYIGWNGVHPLW